MTIFKLFASLRTRLPWLNLPVTFLVMFLQKTPVLNLISLGDEAVPSFPATSILKSAFVAVASLGSVHTLVGASGINSSPSSLTATVGVPSNGAVFTVSGTIADPSSWRIESGNIPPGMNFSTLTGPGVINVVSSNGAAYLQGTPTTAGIYTFTMIAYWYPGGTGLSTNAKSYTVTVNPGPVVAPVIVSSPPSTQTITVGSSLSLAVSVSGAAATTYQWKFNGVNINGAIQSLYSLSPVTVANAGTYTCNVTNAGGTVTSSPAVVVVEGQPVISASPPASQSVSVGSNVSLSVAVSGPVSVNYQWQFNGVNIFGATSSTLTLNSVTAANMGTYVCIVSNLAGIATSTPAVLSLVSTMPKVTTNPSSQTIATGSTVVFSTSITSPLGASYQWQFNGVPIVGATAATYLIQAASSSKAGTYTCVITNSSGSVTTQPAILTLVSSSNPGRLVNLSVLTMDGPGSQLLTIGFVNGGLATTGSEQLLIRATGPALSTFGVSNVLADPKLTIFQGSSVIATNDNWGSTSANITSVNAANSATGAFALSPTTSLDAAVVQTLPSGGYTIQVAGNGTGIGNALAEVYDNTSSYTSASPRLINLSCMQQVPAAGMLTAGFAISGATSKSVLIRASGPTLASYGVVGTMPDPQLTVYTGSTIIATNSSWLGDASITAANTATGAFQFMNTSSKDSAVVMTLAPGSYTVQANSASGSTGVTMIEVYEVP